MAIKNKDLRGIVEDDIDPTEITDRLDMLSHRSDIILRSAQRLLDQIIVMEEEMGEGGGGGGGGGVAVKKPPYGVTGKMLGLYGVEPAPGTGGDKGVGDGAAADNNEKITDLEVKDRGHIVLEKPSLDPSLEPEVNGKKKKNPTQENIDDINKSLGVGYRAGSPPQGGGDVLYEPVEKITIGVEKAE